MNTQQLKVQGAHNVENALTAIAITSIWGALPEQISSALADFAGAEHRQELVRELNGVRYVNDTTATAPAAAIAAINALRPTAAHLILIAGGADKGLDFTDLARHIVGHTKYVLLLDGTATDKLEAAIRTAGGRDLIVGRFANLPSAVERAAGLAILGDVVLLSPGCASFGMFANEFERGNTFKQIVMNLAPDRPGSVQAER
jgi:UDP-N-acetylmuramoylalanine--D-glutamate ligase